jgi:hypothetical protein
MIADKDNDEIEYEWQIIPESTDKKTGGDAERAPKPLKGIFGKSALSSNKVAFAAPLDEGQYRLFLFAHDGKGKVATGNIPFKVTK